MRISLVVPAYNEEKTISQVIKAVRDQVSNVIVIDDGSIDLTAQLAKEAGAKVLTHFLNRGQGAALQTGINFALKQGADIIVTFDADNQFKAEEINQVIKPLLLGNVDVVLGSRFLDKRNQIPRGKEIILKLAVLVTRLYTGLKVSPALPGTR